MESIPLSSISLMHKLLVVALTPRWPTAGSKLDAGFIDDVVCGLIDYKLFFDGSKDDWSNCNHIFVCLHWTSGAEEATSVTPIDITPISAEAVPRSPRHAWAGRLWAQKVLPRTGI